MKLYFIRQEETEWNLNAASKAQNGDSLLQTSGVDCNPVSSLGKTAILIIYLIRFTLVTRLVLHSAKSFSRETIFAPDLIPISQKLSRGNGGLANEAAHEKNELKTRCLVVTVWLNTQT